MASASVWEILGLQTFGRSRLGFVAADDFCNSSFFKEPQLASSRPRILKLKAYLLESWHERSGFTVGTASVGFGLVGLGLVVPVVWGMPAHLYSVLIFFTSISLNPFLCPSLQLPRFPFFLIVAFPFYKKNYRHASEIVEHRRREVFCCEELLSIMINECYDFHWRVSH